MFFNPVELQDDSSADKLQSTSKRLQFNSRRHKISALAPLAQNRPVKLQTIPQQSSLQPQKRNTSSTSFLNTMKSYKWLHLPTEENEKIAVRQSKNHQIPETIVAGKKLRSPQNNQKTQSQIRSNVFPATGASYQKKYQTQRKDLNQIGGKVVSKQRETKIGSKPRKSQTSVISSTKEPSVQIAKDLIDEQQLKMKEMYSMSTRNLPDLLASGFRGMDQIKETVEYRRKQRNQRRAKKQLLLQPDAEEYVSTNLHVPVSHRGRQPQASSSKKALSNSQSMKRRVNEIAQNLLIVITSAEGGDHLQNEQQDEDYSNLKQQLMDLSLSPVKMASNNSVSRLQKSHHFDNENSQQKPTKDNQCFVISGPEEQKKSYNHLIKNTASSSKNQKQQSQAVISEQQINYSPDSSKAQNDIMIDELRQIQAPTLFQVESSDHHLDNSNTQKHAAISQRSLNNEDQPQQAFIGNIRQNQGLGLKNQQFTSPTHQNFQDIVFYNDEILVPAREKSSAFQSTSQMLKPVVVDTRNVNSGAEQMKRFPIVRLNTMKQKRSNDFDSLTVNRHLQFGSRLLINHNENEKLSETSKSLLFIDGPKQIPSVTIRPPLHQNRRARNNDESKTPRSSSLGESPSIADDENSRVPLTKKYKKITKVVEELAIKSSELSQEAKTANVVYFDSSRKGGNETQQLITTQGNNYDDSIVNDVNDDEDDDDEFNVSDNMLNDSILLQRPNQKGNSINFNVFSFADDASLRANGGMIEPQLLDQISQSTYKNKTKPSLHFNQQKTSVINPGGQQESNNSKSLTRKHSKNSSLNLLPPNIKNSLNYSSKIDSKNKKNYNLETSGKHHNKKSVTRLSLGPKLINKTSQVAQHQQNDSLYNSQGTITSRDGEMNQNQSNNASKLKKQVTESSKSVIKDKQMMQSTLPLFANRSKQAELDYPKDSYRNGDKIITSHRLNKQSTKGFETKQFNDQKTNNATMSNKFNIYNPLWQSYADASQISSKKQNNIVSHSNNAKAVSKSLSKKFQDLNQPKHSRQINSIYDEIPQHRTNLLPLKKQMTVKQKLNNIRQTKGSVEDEIRSLEMINDQASGGGINLSNIFQMTETSSSGLNPLKINGGKQLTSYKNKQKTSKLNSTSRVQTDMNFYNPSAENSINSQTKMIQASAQQYSIQMKTRQSGLNFVNSNEKLLIGANQKLTSQSRDISKGKKSGEDQQRFTVAHKNYSHARMNRSMIQDDDEDDNDNVNRSAFLYESNMILPHLHQSRIDHNNKASTKQSAEDRSSENSPTIPASNYQSQQHQQNITNSQFLRRKNSTKKGQQKTDQLLLNESRPSFAARQKKAVKSLTKLYSQHQQQHQGYAQSQTRSKQTTQRHQAQQQSSQNRGADQQQQQLFIPDHLFNNDQHHENTGIKLPSMIPQKAASKIIQNDIQNEDYDEDECSNEKRRNNNQARILDNAVYRSNRKKTGGNTAAALMKQKQMLQQKQQRREKTNSNVRNSYNNLINMNFNISNNNMTTNENTNNSMIHHQQNQSITANLLSSGDRLTSAPGSDTDQQQSNNAYDEGGNHQNQQFIYHQSNNSTQRNMRESSSSGATTAAIIGGSGLARTSHDAAFNVNSGKIISGTATLSVNKGSSQLQKRESTRISKWHKNRKQQAQQPTTMVQVLVTNYPPTIESNQSYSLLEEQEGEDETGKFAGNSNVVLIKDDNDMFSNNLPPNHQYNNSAEQLFNSSVEQFNGDNTGVLASDKKLQLQKQQNMSKKLPAS